MTQPTSSTQLKAVRRRRQIVKPRHAHAPHPWLAVVLAVDTAAQSGHALVVAGRVRSWGEVNTRASGALTDIVVDAASVAEQCGLPLVLVLEASFGGSTFVITALGQARERWLRAWRDAGQEDRRVVLVQPQTWRAVMLGKGRRPGGRDGVRAVEQRLATTLVGRSVSGDEAPALLIGRWASRALKVGGAIGKTWMKRSLQCWRSQ